MAITPTSTPITVQKLDSAAIKPGIAISTGQSLVVNVTKIQGNTIQFKLGTQTFQATTPTPLPDTGKLQVTVKQTTPSVILAIQTLQSEAPKNTAQVALRQMLPNQMPINQAIQLINQPALLQLLPPALQAQIATLNDRMFKANDQLSAKDIKQLIQKSGLFLESDLKAKSPIDNDTKGSLLQLKQASQASGPAATTLSSILDKAINKITIQQIQLFENPSLLNIEIPMSPPYQLKKIEVDIRKNKQQDQNHFEVIIQAELNRGEMITKLILNKEDQLSIYLWADNGLLTHAMSASIASLQTQFNDAGLYNTHIQITKVKPKEDIKLQRVSLIDITV